MLQNVWFLGYDTFHTKATTICSVFASRLFGGALLLSCSLNLFLPLAIDEWGYSPTCLLRACQGLSEVITQSLIRDGKFGTRSFTHISQHAFWDCSAVNSSFRNQSEKHCPKLNFRQIETPLAFSGHIFSCQLRNFTPLDNSCRKKYNGSHCSHRWVRGDKTSKYKSFISNPATTQVR